MYQEIAALQLALFRQVTTVRHQLPQNPVRFEQRRLARDVPERRLTFADERFSERDTCADALTELERRTHILKTRFAILFKPGPHHKVAALFNSACKGFNAVPHQLPEEPDDTEETLHIRSLSLNSSSHTGFASELLNVGSTIVACGSDASLLAEAPDTLPAQVKGEIH
ncbi:hypothetical protein [uncultured Tateyamaria sp.]|uniref:hypothetical protein n=1 Tax=uncultured Tateyamaria sp. TaxID=455651 RepID=UPI002629C64A|nr:hypothetical protein [uncultured Tateyamaria sp.]